MLPKPISILHAQFDKFALRPKPTGTVHNRPPMPDVCAICMAPLWGVANDDDDGEGGDYTRRVGEVDMPPDLEQEVRRQLGPRAVQTGSSTRTGCARRPTRGRRATRRAGRATSCP